MNTFKFDGKLALHSNNIKANKRNLKVGSADRKLM